MMRKCCTLCQELMPTSGHDCPGETKLAKQIKLFIGSDAVMGDAEEGFDPKEVGFGESGANPSPSSGSHPEVAEATEASSADALPSVMERRRPCRAIAKEREAKWDEFAEMCRLNLLSMQESAEAERQQRKEEGQRASCKLMQMRGTSLASTASAWVAGNKEASAVFRPGQQPAVEGLHGEQEEALEEEAPRHLCHSTQNKTIAP